MLFGELPRLKRLTKTLKPRSIAMTWADAEKIAGYMTGDAKDVLLILRATGMRPCELFRSRWEHVDLDAGRLYVGKSKTRAGMRFVPLLRALPILRRRHLEAGLPKQGWIFPSEKQKPGHLESIRDEFNAARDGAGFPPEMVPYTARHGYATVAAQVLTTKELQTVLGHADAKTTFRYQHVDDRLLGTKLEALETDGHIN